MTDHEKRRKSSLAGLLIAAVLACALAVPAFAASSGHTISSVSIRVSSDIEPGSILPAIDYGIDETTARDGGVTVSVSGSRYYIYDAVWTTSTTKVMTAGYSPQMKVTLEPTDPDDYYFSGSYKSSNVTIHGGTFVSASKSNGRLVVRLKVNPIKGSFDPPEDVTWRYNSKATATWDEPDENDSGKYEVQLKRGSTTVVTIETTSKSYNFYPYMTEAGTYSFRVRTIPKTSTQEQYGTHSEWVESSEIYIAEDEVADGTGISSEGEALVESQGLAGWIYDTGRWFYRYPNGTYLMDGWLCLGGNWYLFDTDGVMVTGWELRDDHWYYFDPDGVMHTGWLVDQDEVYYLNPTPDAFQGCMFADCAYPIDGATYCFGSDGRLLTGWQQVGDNWYYFYPDTGSMAVDTVIDTFTVGPDGAWVG